MIEHCKITIFFWIIKFRLFSGAFQIVASTINRSRHCEGDSLKQSSCPVCFSLDCFTLRVRNDEATI
jgi:hypothetical protein